MAELKQYAAEPIAEVPEMKELIDKKIKEMAELKPCPFHKKIEKKKLPKGCFYPPEDFAIEDSYMFEGYFHVRCCYCHACGPDEETEQQAIDAWNKRS